MWSLLLAFYVLATAVVASPVLGYGAPVFGVILTLIAMAIIGQLGGRVRLSLGEWMALGGLTVFVGLLWANWMVRSAEEVQLVLAVTYRLGAVVFAVFLAHRIGLSVFTAVVLAAVALVVSGVSAVGLDPIALRQGTLYGDAVNQMAIVLALGFGIGLWIAAEVGERRVVGRSVALVLALGLGAGIMAVGSRQGVILAASWLPMVALLGRARWLLIYGVVTGGVVLAVGAGDYLAYRTDRFISFLAEGNPFADGSASLRLALMVYAAGAWIEAPVFGQGIRAFEKMSPFGVYSHNNYLELLYNYGVTGFAAFYVPFLAALTAAIGHVKHHASRSWGALMLGVIIFSLVRDVFIVSYFRHSTWVALIIAFVAWRKSVLAREERVPDGHGVSFR